MKIRTKVKAGGRDCAAPDVQSGQATQRPHNPGTPATVRPFPNQETIMKIRTKVKAGRGCGGALPDVQSGRATQRPHNPGTPATVRPFLFPSQGDDHEDQDQGQGRSRLWRHPRNLVGPRHVETTSLEHAGNGVSLYP